MKLRNCPFCKQEAVFQSAFIWNDKNAVRCGCKTLGCRGYYKDSPIYDGEDFIENYNRMEKKWNRRN